MQGCVIVTIRIDHAQFKPNLQDDCFEQFKTFVVVPLPLRLSSDHDRFLYEITTCRIHGDSPRIEEPLRSESSSEPRQCNRGLTCSNDDSTRLITNGLLVMNCDKTRFTRSDVLIKFTIVCCVSTVQRRNHGPG